MRDILRHIIFGPNKKPTKLWLEISDQCNSRCKYCSIWSHSKSSKHPLTIEEYRAIFSDPLLSDIAVILNSGGEPTLRKELPQILELEAEYFPNALIQVSTNGLVAYPLIDAIHPLLERGIKVNVGLSIDGPSEIYKKMRGVDIGNVLFTIDMLNSLRERYPNLSVSIGFLLTEDNYKYVDWFKNLCEMLNVNYLIQWKNRSTFYFKYGKSETFEGEREVVESLGQEFNMLREKWLDWIDGNDIRFDCRALRDFFVIDIEGLIRPCLSMWGAVCGNLRTMTPTEWWNSDIRKIGIYEVNDCDGCLNSWGTYWSWESTGIPYLKYYIKHPLKLYRKIRDGK